MLARGHMDQALTFRTAMEFREWLSANHRKSDGLWVRIFKKNSGEVTVTYAESLDEALCFGWIDAPKQRHDDASWLQRFTPRRSKSGWSRVNTQHAERLLKAGRMQTAGRTQIEAAKKDGCWKAAYDSPSTGTFPKDFLAACVRTRRRKCFSTRSTKRIVTQSLTGCKRPRSQKQSKSGWK